MQRALMLAIIQVFANYRREEKVGDSFLFLIDEAELHLHPTAQRLLKNSLEDISKTDQVIINTHSSVLVTETRDNESLFKAEKVDGRTQIDKVSDLDKAEIVFDLLGGSPYDLLLPRNFLVVEGKSEYYLIRGIMGRFYPEQVAGIKVLYASGDTVQQSRSIDAIHRALTPLVGDDSPLYRDKLVILVDKQNPGQKSNYDRLSRRIRICLKTIESTSSHPTT